MLTTALLLTMLIAQPPVFTACRMDEPVSQTRTMGQQLKVWQERSDWITENNAQWWVGRYRKGWEQYPPPWSIKKRVDEILQSNDI